MSASSVTSHRRANALVCQLAPANRSSSASAVSMQPCHSLEKTLNTELMDIKAARARSANAANYAAFHSLPRGGSLAGKTLFVSGASRGIGLAIALRAAQDGANVIVAAKTTEPQPNLPGTIYTAAAEIEKAGGKALAVVCDIRSEESVRKAIEAGVAKFGGLDILVNNASAIALTGTEDTNMKKYDLMHQINARGTFLCTKLALPYLRKSSNPHVLTLGPPLNAIQQPGWFSPHPAYTTAKYNMSIYTMAHAAEYANEGIAANCLWPLTTIATAAVQNLLGGSEMMAKSRTANIMADAAHAILVAPSKKITGQFFVDEHVLKAIGIKNLDKYACVPGTDPDSFAPDFFV